MDAGLPSFLITIDTEGDDLWSRPQKVATRNASYLERFQELCEEFGLRPTWLTNHEMIESPAFQAFARDVIGRGTGEIGMHLHAWDSPPIRPLTKNDGQAHPYLIEYPRDVMREKIRALTCRLEDALGVKMTSHRAGRWGFDERYASMLIEEGYTVDCSVTPLISWRSSHGDPSGVGGPDYRDFPHEAYWVDPTNISRPGVSELLEVPTTVLEAWPSPLRAMSTVERRLPEKLAAPVSLLTQSVSRVWSRTLWLRPDGRNLPKLRTIARRVRSGERSYAEFMIHSSELMPGGSPTFPTEESIEGLYNDLNTLFATEIKGSFRGATLAEFHDQYALDRRAIS